MESLTATEERIMQVLWKLKSAFVKDVIEELPEPKPPYNTVSSVIRLLEKKGYVDHKAYGKTHEYFPVVEKKAYSKRTFKNMLGDYFEGSYKSLVSFIVNEEKLSEDEIMELEALIANQRKARQGG
ncbi:MAG: BlaI/MecI/CopY family transcriptional regulator [Flavobacteriales bacterium]